MEELTLQAKEARKDYKRQYRLKKREKITRKQRAPYQDYGITPERLNELKEIAKKDKYAGIVLTAAMKADRLSAAHIILSVTKGISYDNLEYHEQLGRCPIGRTNFYGARRLFFHYLDCALKELRTRNNEEISKQGKHKNGGCYE